MLCFKGGKSQSPQTGQFNSYSFSTNLDLLYGLESQSPQTGQFNSYYSKNVSNICSNSPHSLNPLKRVNSILTEAMFS